MSESATFSLKLLFMPKTLWGVGTNAAPEEEPEPTVASIIADPDEPEAPPEAEPLEVEPLEVEPLEVEPLEVEPLEVEPLDGVPELPCPEDPVDEPLPCPPEELPDPFVYVPFGVLQ